LITSADKRQRAGYESRTSLQIRFGYLGGFAVSNLRNDGFATALSGFLLIVIGLPVAMVVLWAFAPAFPAKVFLSRWRISPKSTSLQNL
jgi:hypothetical protein